jgi:beta-glucosidase
VFDSLPTPRAALGTGGAPILALMLTLCTGCASPDWPRVHSAVATDPVIEARVSAIVAGMTLAQKVGQMTQAEIKAITPAEVQRYYIGSVLNGGGSRPGGNRRAALGDWLALADAYHAASMATDMAIRVPIIWGTDAVHGHNNVFGATLFPHNIGLGAARDAGLAGEIGAATAKAVRASGLHWVFAPTLAVVRDDRWGRTYESYSEDPRIVAELAGAVVAGLQGRLTGDANVVATAKHFMGDGGTEQGIDQGVTRASRAEMTAIHGAGYYPALAAGVQTVMASFNSWDEVAASGEVVASHGKMHGSHLMLTEVLKGKLGFDGLVVTDWNGVGQVPGCSNASCAQAINAGIDMVMVPIDWKAFIANTIAQVQGGQIPMARIDDAVARILRVKLRAGLFDKRPSQGAWAGKPEALQARALARSAVRQSLVLLKNNAAVLPLARGKRILVVGKSADSVQNQSGGWSMTWQGSGNSNADFPAGDSILAGIRDAVGGANVDFSETAAGVDARGYDAVVAVIGEAPYAEGSGDIPPSGTLRHTSRYPEDLAVLQRVAGQGVPVVTVFLSGRPLHVNDLLNLSDAFVAAWLPGTEGKGVADVLFRAGDGSVAFDFSGRLSFSWPNAACQTPLNVGDAGYAPLFPLGYGLGYGLGHTRRAEIGALPVEVPSGGCAAQHELLIFNRSAQPPYTLEVDSTSGRWKGLPIPIDPAETLVMPAAGATDIRVSTVQINTQQDAKRVAWSGPARFSAWSLQKAELGSFADGALVFDTVVEQAPSAAVRLMMVCGTDCKASLDVTRLFTAMPLNQRRTLKIPLACFAARGADLKRIEHPFSIATDAAFTAAFAHIRVVAGAARDADAVRCQDLPLPTPP